MVKSSHISSINSVYTYIISNHHPKIVTHGQFIAIIMIVKIKQVTFGDLPTFKAIKRDYKKSKTLK